MVKHLFGREHEIHAFADALQKADEEAPKVIVFYGPGGQGKTQLCTAVASVASQGDPKRRFCLIDFKAHSTNPVDALYAIRIALIKGVFLKRPLFDVAFREYQMRLNPAVDIVRRFPELYVQAGAGSNTDVIVEIAASTLAHVPFVSVAEKYTRKLTDHVGHKTTSARPELAGMDLWTDDEWHQKLPALLAQDISEFKSDQPCPVILFDHYEYLWERRMEHGSISVNVDAWVRTFCENLSRGICAIFSRERIEHWPELSYEWRESMTEIAVSSLSARDSLKMLTAARVVGRSIRKQIVRLASGHPLFLTVQIETYRSIVRAAKTPGVEDFGTVKRDVISRFVDHLDPKDGQALKVLALPETIDRDAFEYLAESMPNIFFGLTFEAIAAYSFFQFRQDGTAVMHSVMRNGLQAMCDPRTARRTHETLFRYAAERWGTIDDKNIPPAVALFRMAAWHKLHCDEVGYLHWIVSFPESSFTNRTEAEVEQARKIAERRELPNEELECICRLLEAHSDRKIVYRAVQLLEKFPAMEFDGREHFRAMQIAEEISTGDLIQIKQTLGLCTAIATEPGFLQGLNAMWKASFYRCWALSALYCGQEDVYESHQRQALRELDLQDSEQKPFFAFSLYELLNYLLSVGKFQQVRDAATDGVRRLTQYEEAQSRSQQPGRHLLRVPLLHRIGAPDTQAMLDELRSVTRQTDEQLDQKSTVPSPREGEMGGFDLLELRQMLLPGMNIGLMVNARGRLCLVHDQRFPVSGAPALMFYDTLHHSLLIAFYGCDVVHRIDDWEANAHMRPYLQRAKTVLMIRMQDRQPVEGWETSMSVGRFEGSRFFPETENPVESR